MRVLIVGAALLGFLFSEGLSRAEIYKYKKNDGTTVYTDNIGELPRDRREYYDKIKEEKERAHKELEQRLGKEEVARREAEAKKKELEHAQMDERERQQRMAAIDAAIKEVQAKQGAREAQREQWRKRMQDARQKLDQLLAQFKQKQEEANGIAIKPSFSWLPGEADRLDTLRKELARMEQEIDQLIDEVDNRIPEEARKAGIPPGFLR
jgi:DNA repair exonuclease SbcCD ATPase subunit